MADPIRALNLQVIAVNDILLPVSQTTLFKADRLWKLVLTECQRSAEPNRRMCQGIVYPQMVCFSQTRLLYPDSKRLASCEFCCNESATKAESLFFYRGWGGGAMPIRMVSRVSPRLATPWGVPAAAQTAWPGPTVCSTSPTVNRPVPSTT